MGNIKGVELVAVSTPFCIFINVLYCHVGEHWHIPTRTFPKW